MVPIVGHKPRHIIIMKGIELIVPFQQIQNKQKNLLIGEAGFSLRNETEPEPIRKTSIPVPAVGLRSNSG